MPTIPESEWREAIRTVGTSPSQHATWLLRVMTLEYIPIKERHKFCTELTYFIHHGETDSRQLIADEHAEEWHRRLHQGYVSLGRGHQGKIQGRFWSVRVGQYYTGYIGKDGKTSGRLIICDTAQYNDDKNTRYDMSHDSNTKRGYPLNRDQLGDDLLKALRVLEGRLCRCPRCEALFIRERRQRFCTEACGARNRMKIFRAKPKLIDSR